MTSTGPRLTPRRLRLLRQATLHPRGSIAADIMARDTEALEQLDYVASIDDCGHVNTDPDATSSSEHRSHPHFLRITAEGRAAVEAAGPGEPDTDAPAMAPRAAWPARVSHYTSPRQLADLEALRTTAKADGRAAVPVAALLRAATAICLTDPDLRARMVDLARTDWR